MNPLYSAAQDLANVARNLVAELEGMERIPSSQQLAAIQEEINQLQQRLNSLQTQTDTYTDVREAG
jgi:uncharacterized protein YlxW (UPF0749 family)